MAAVVQPTSSNLDGPWLLSKDSLETLDTIVDDEIKRLKELGKADAEKVIRRRQREFRNSNVFGKLSPEERQLRQKAIRTRYLELYPYETEKRELKITTKSKRVLRFTRFSEAELDQDLKTDTPLAFDLDFHLRGIWASIGTSHSWSSDLRIHVHPESEQATQVMNRLENWARDNQATFREQAWLKYSGLHWIVLTVILGVTLVFLAAIKLGELQSLKSEARMLVDQALLDEYHPRALEVALRLASEYPKDPPRSEVPFWFWSIAATLVVISIALSFPPKAILGIARGRRSIILWRKWSVFVTYTVPVSIFFFGFVLPVAREYWRSIALQ